MLYVICAAYMRMGLTPDRMGRVERAPFAPVPRPYACPAASVRGPPVRVFSAET